MGQIFPDHKATTFPNGNTPKTYTDYFPRIGLHRCCQIHVKSHLVWRRPLLPRVPCQNFRPTLFFLSRSATLRSKTSLQLQIPTPPVTLASYMPLPANRHARAALNWGDSRQLLRCTSHVYWLRHWSFSSHRKFTANTNNTQTGLLLKIKPDRASAADVLCWCLGATRHILAVENAPTNSTNSP